MAKHCLVLSTIAKSPMSRPQRSEIWISTDYAAGVVALGDFNSLVWFYTRDDENQNDQRLDGSRNLSVDASILAEAPKVNVFHCWHACICILSDCMRQVTRCVVLYKHDVPDVCRSILEEPNLSILTSISYVPEQISPCYIYIIIQKRV